MRASGRLTMLAVFTCRATRAQRFQSGSRVAGALLLASLLFVASRSEGAGGRRPPARRPFRACRGLCRGQLEARGDGKRGTGAGTADDVARILGSASHFTPADPRPGSRAACDTGLAAAWRALRSGRSTAAAWQRPTRGDSAARVSSWPAARIIANRTSPSAGRAAGGAAGPGQADVHQIVCLPVASRPLRLDGPLSSRPGPHLD